MNASFEIKFSKCKKLFSKDIKCLNEHDHFTWQDLEYYPNVCIVNEIHFSTKNFYEEGRMGDFHGTKELFFRSVTPLIASRDHFVPFIFTPRSLTSLCLDESSRPPRQLVFQVHRRELSTDSRHFRGIIFSSIHTLNPRRISLPRRLSIFSLSFFFFFSIFLIHGPHIGRSAFRPVAHVNW